MVIQLLFKIRKFFTLINNDGNKNLKIHLILDFDIKF